MSDHTCSDRPSPTCKTSIVVTATIFTLFKANTKETTKEVARPEAAPPLLLWRPQAATFVQALNRVNIVAVTTILVFHVGNGRFEHVRLDIMFRAVRASCSLAVRAMRACARGKSRGSCSRPLGHHVPSPFVPCALARKVGPGGLAPWAGGLGATER